MNILFVSADQGGCRHYRVLLPARELHRNGHTVLIAGDLVQRPSGEIGAPSADDSRRTAFGFDIVVLQRWMHEEAPDVIRRARATGQVIINDVDDWWFGLPTSNAAFEGTHKTTDARWNVEHYRKVLAASTALTASTPYLGHRLEALGRPVFVLRNAIDLERYEPRTVDPESLVIGWHGHLQHRAAGDVQQLAGVLGAFMDRHENARFLHVGSEGEGDAERMCAVLGLDRSRLLTRPPFHISQMHHKLSGIDIGVAPLEDCPFNRSKSAVKVQEYAATGLPAIASDLDEYRWFGAAVLCRRPKDWTEALERLADPDERSRSASAARARVRELDISIRWGEWERTYMQVLAGALAAQSLASTASAPEAPSSLRFPSRRASVRSTRRASKSG